MVWEAAASRRSAARARCSSTARSGRRAPRSSTRSRPNGEPITLEPMTKFPLVRDLVVDRSRMFEDLKKVKAWIDLDGTHELGPGPRQSPENQEEAYPLSRCMTCGCCLEACPQVNDALELHRPAAISQVRLFNLHPTRQDARERALETLMGEGGVADCGKAQNCVEVCPEGDPARGLDRRRSRETTKHMLSAGSSSSRALRSRGYGRDPRACSSASASLVLAFSWSRAAMIRARSAPAGERGLVRRERTIRRRLERRRRRADRAAPAAQRQRGRVGRGDLRHDHQRVPRSKGLTPYARWTGQRVVRGRSGQERRRQQKRTARSASARNSAQNECPGWAGPRSEDDPAVPEGHVGRRPGRRPLRRDGGQEVHEGLVRLRHGSRTARIWSVQNFR